VKLAILGGSFNPVHAGHLYLAETALSAGYDRVILVPAFVSPFKPGAGDSAAQDRLDMLAAALTANSALALEDCEIKREGISYTIDTIGDIITRYRPEGKPGLLLGDDLAPGFPKWRRAGEIAEMTDLIVARRTSAAKLDLPFRCTYLDNAILDISSAGIRRNIRAGGPWRSLVPEGVRLIIEERGLYRAEDQAPQAGIRSLCARVETAARSMLNSARFLHSRGAALVASDLAVRFGLDRDLAYLAGIAHDMAKELPEEDLKRLAKRDGGGFSKLERKKPSMLHGRAAASLLRENFGLRSEAVLEAVRVHTFGDPGMGPLAKVVYIADKTEPGRVRIPPELRAYGNYAGLDEYFVAVLEATVAYLESKKYELSSGTKRLLSAERRKKSP
jgi:nicotinate-nucleotide adenylyltransferase